MTIRAERDPRFYLRFLMIGLAALGFALWALYDGLIGYPNQREYRRQIYQSLVDEDRVDLWDEHALENDWPIDAPGSEEEQKHFDAEIKGQYAMAVGAAAVSFLVFLLVWRSRGRWIELNDQGLTSSWGQAVAFDQAESLEKRQWRSKGIARLQYNDGGRTRTFVIDDFKFKRAATDEILAELEKRIGLDKIMGGPPEGFEPVEAEALAEAETAAEG